MFKFTVCLCVSFLLFTSMSFSEANKCVSHYSVDAKNPENSGNTKNAETTDSVSRILDLKYAEGFLFKNLRDRYDVEKITHIGKILDQKNWGLCHLYSLFEEITREFRQRNDGKDPEVSLHYLAFHHWYARALKTALDETADLKPPEGGWYPSTFDTFKRVGVMTNEQWKLLNGKTDVEDSLNYFLEEVIMKKNIADVHRQQRLLNFILKSNFSDAEIADYPKLSEVPLNTQELKLKYAKMKHRQELLQSDKLSELEEFLALKEKQLKNNETSFTRIQLAVLKEIANGKTSLLSKLDDNDIELFHRNLKSDIKGEINSLFGSFFFGTSKIPEQVLKIDDQVQLSKELFPEMGQSTVSIGIDEDKRRFGPGVKFELDGQPDRKNGHVYLNTSLDNLHEIIASSIKANNGVWLGYDHVSSFVAKNFGESRKKLGLMSPKAFSWWPRSPYINRKTRVQEGIFEGGHAVQIVGVIREKLTPEQISRGEEGKLVGYLIQNSWGVEAGQRGFYIMTKEYFDAFAFGITIRDETIKDEQIKDEGEVRKKTRGKPAEDGKAGNGNSSYRENKTGDEKPTQYEKYKKLFY